MLDVKIGAQPILWKNTPLEAVAREAAELGYDGIEAPVAAYRDRPDDLRRLLDETGLEVCGTFTGGYFIDPATREAEIRNVVETAKLLPQFGCTTLISAPGGLRKDRKAYSLWEYRSFCEALNEIGRRVADFGVTQVFHNHAWTLIETRLEVDLLCEHTDPRYLKMGFDTGHLHLGWADPVEVMEAYGDRVAYLHIKDACGRADYWDGIKNDEGCWVELGAGEVDLAGIIRVLDQHNFTGWLCYEQDNSQKPARESAALSIAHLKKLLAARQ